MKRIIILTMFFVGCLLPAEWVHAQKPIPNQKLNPRIAEIARQRGADSTRPVSQHAGLPILPASPSSEITWIECPPEAQYYGAACGTLPVPLDRNHPTRGTININFELYMHSGSGSAESVILFNLGWGAGTTTFRDVAFMLLFPNLDAHDLLLIDDRGRGLSGTIDCLELQHGTASWNQAMGDCAAQLGGADSRYGSGDVAQDTEAVRVALGYDKVDYYGISYGGADVTAYATRFGSHLRSMVLVAPVGTPDLGNPLANDRWRANAEARMVGLDCKYSPTCSSDHRFPNAELEGLIWSVRLKPVQGDAYDANGNLRHVVIDENALLNYLIDNDTGRYASTGEILAAADSLWLGDPGPLLRLGAEGYFPNPPESGDPTLESMGGAMATYCVDATQPYDWFKPLSERAKQLEDSVAALPLSYFAPFSKRVATALPYGQPRTCLYWEKPTPSSPVAPPNPIYPSVPTLFLTGVMDKNVPSEQVKKMAALFPTSTLVTVAGIGHPWPTTWPFCAISLASGFIETLQAGDTSCTKTPETVWPAVGRFPLLARSARPADTDPDGQNQIGLAERKVVTVAVATATDALQRSWIGVGDGVGLRAGTFHTDYGDGSVWTTTLTNCAFSKDVAVNGTVTWNYSGALVADLTVSGSGTAGGTLHVEGAWQAPGPVGNFKVSGMLSGKQVAVLVPEA